MTGLNMISSESLQILNYGIGGYFNLHFDFAAPGDTSFDSLGQGNRIATVMFYVNNFVNILLPNVLNVKIENLSIDERCSSWWWYGISHN